MYSFSLMNHPVPTGAPEIQRSRRPRKRNDRMTLYCLPDGSMDELVCVPKV
ncbi:MAG: hypothetical protein HYX32_14760 [Actinobacteria bacterium]|nr:hypothetical protein [Actinomycetota bacterium]